ncbi:hypothetical protein [Flammeovirga agarivorans]|uniref:Uncharacterized protein n=1 Tax=Flammeovirga agarivorans TaxID=2726742 RepID=A0A7X8SI78_9BACT|nr:hypothetical protein [Flammeovirga agarivorans]NLR90685.1 hypothetical protein [Flammeovirga agarivorans]
MSAKFWKFFLHFSGVATLLGPLPSMISPVSGTLLTLKLDISSVNGLAPVIGHWGIMIVGIGVLIFLSASQKEIRKTTLLYAIAEKVYMVSGGVYTLITLPEVGMNFIPVIISDTIQIIGFTLYFAFEKRRQQKHKSRLVVAQ